MHRMRVAALVLVGALGWAVLATPAVSVGVASAAPGHGWQQPNRGW